MHITKVDTSDLGIGQSTGERSTGLHMSTIYKDLMHDLEPKRFKNDGKFDYEKLEMGLSFENMLERGIQERMLPDLVRPGEIISDEGIAMTPDGVTFDPLKVHEFKATWMSSRQGITDQKFFVWFVQMKAYCYEMGTPLARLWVFFVNGNYDQPYKPLLCSWDITFTSQELRENRSMLINHARKKGLLRK